MHPLPTLDAHAHVSPSRSPDELSDIGAVLAMTLSLEEAAQVIGRRDLQIAWGVGCHPRRLRAQESFDRDWFLELARQTAVVGELGLDGGTRTPLHVQRRTFRETLAVLAHLPRFVSIHSYRATGIVLEELRRTPFGVPVLHWWTGTLEETREAVDLGCHFSIHPAIARHAKFRKVVPPDRLLIESDLGYGDPPGGIPHRIAWAEHLVAQQFGRAVSELRQLVWENFGRIVSETNTRNLLPYPLVASLTALDR